MTIFLTLKMNNPFILTFLLFLSSVAKLAAQDKLIKGVVYNENRKPLPWVNIGIRNKNPGTVSNDKGIFELKVPQSLQNDTLLFSAVGLQEIRLPIKNLTDHETILLERKTTALNEVVITNKKRKRIIRGTTGYTPLLWLNLNTIKNKNSYAEFGQLIKIKEPVQLLNAKAKVEGKKKSTDSITYRLNIYKVENGLPGTRLVEKELIKSFMISEKELSFDLKTERIFLEEDCIVAFEYIPKENKLKSPLLAFRVSITGNGGFSRIASIGKWTPIGGGSASISAELEQ